MVSAATNPADTTRSSRRKALLNAAVEVFSEKGYHAASVADILEKAGIARGTFYRYFDSKKDCFAAALDDFLARLREPLQRLDMSQPLGEQEMIRLFQQVATVLISNPRDRQFARILLIEGVGSDRLFAQKMLDYYEEITEMTAGFIKTAIDARRARSLDPDTTARCILGMVKEILSVWAMDESRKNDLGRMLLTTIDFAFYGLLPRTTQ